MPATLLIKPWHDPVVDTLGHDPRSRYVEQFWLPTLGPTALLLLRHLADRFDRDPEGVELTVVDTSHALGLGQREGSASPIVRTLRRLTQFDLACEDPMSDTVAVRRNVPPVNTRHLRRLPRDLQRARTPSGRSSSSPRLHSPRPVDARAGSRSRCSSRATIPTTWSARCTPSASIPRCATRARSGPTNATARRSTTRRASRRSDSLPRSRFELAPVLAAAPSGAPLVPWARRSLRTATPAPRTRP